MSEQPLPPTEPKNRKEITKRFRVTEPELSVITSKADASGLSFSEYVRRAALGKEINEKVPPAIRKHASNIANNLNQLTRLANSGKLNSTSAHDLEQLVQALLTIVK